MKKTILFFVLVVLTLPGSVFAVQDSDQNGAIDITKGGTNATSAAGALANIGAEPALGNPSVDAQCVKSTVAGVRSWGACSGAEVDPVFTAAPASGITADQAAAISGANLPSATNVFATANDVFSGSYLDLTNKPTIPSTPGEVGAEPAAGNPAGDNYCFTSLMNGTRAWLPCGGSAAADISYDNTTSGLTATTVQGAVDENAASIAGLGAIDVPLTTNTEFQAAITSMLSTGGKINLASGVFYAPTGAMCGFDFRTATAKITVEGAGEGQTILKWPSHEKGASTKNTLANGEFVVCAGDDFTLKNLTVDGNHWADWLTARTSPGTVTENQTITDTAITQEGAGGVLIKDHDNVVLDQVEVVNTSFTPVSITGTSTNTLIQNSKIHDSYGWDAQFNTTGSGRFTATGDYTSVWGWGVPIGVYSGISASKVRLINDDVYYNGGDGYNASGTSDIEVKGGSYDHNGLGFITNLIGVCGSGGLYFAHGSNKVRVDGVYAGFNTETGFQFDGTQSGGKNKNFTVINSIAEGNDDSGFLSMSNEVATFTNNLALDNNYDGTTCVSAARDSGFIFQDDTQHTISHNVSIDSQATPTQAYGFYFTDGGYDSYQSENIAFRSTTGDIHDDPGYVKFNYNAPQASASFETNLDGYTFSDGGEINSDSRNDRTTSEYHDGLYSVGIFGSDNGAGTYKGASLAQTFSVTPGAYTLSFWVKRADANAVLAVSGTTDGSIYAESIALDGWLHYTTTVNFSSSETITFFNSDATYGSYQTGYWIDGIVITKLAQSGDTLVSNGTTWEPGMVGDIGTLDTTISSTDTGSNGNFDIALDGTSYFSLGYDSLNSAPTFTVTNDGAAQINLYSTGTGSSANYINFLRANGTAASPAAVNSGDYLGTLNVRGAYAAGTFDSNRTAVQIIATENWSSAGGGYKFDFKTRANGVAMPTGTTVRLTIPDYGGMQWADATEPTCDSSTRGSVVMVQGGTSAADTFRICAKNSSDTYSWYDLATIP